MCGMSPKRPVLGAAAGLNLCLAMVEVLHQDGGTTPDSVSC